MMGIALAVSGLAMSSPPGDDIVVLAQKLRTVRVSASVKRRDGVMLLKRCRLKKASGDTDIDAIPCEMTRLCVGQNPPSKEALKECIEGRSQDRIDEIVKARRDAAERGA